MTIPISQDAERVFSPITDFSVLTAGDGEEAVSQATRGMPGAVIFEAFMPGLPGLGTLKRIRTREPKIVVILVSGISSPLEILEQAGVGRGRDLREAGELRGDLALPGGLGGSQGLLVRLLERTGRVDRYGLAIRQEDW